MAKLSASADISLIVASIRSRQAVCAVIVSDYKTRPQKLTPEAVCGGRWGRRRGEAAGGLWTLLGARLAASPRGMCADSYEKHSGCGSSLPRLAVQNVGLQDLAPEALTPSAEVRLQSGGEIAA